MLIKRLLFFAYLILITTLSLLPSSDLPKVVLFPHADKLIHMGMYGGFTFLLLWGWPKTFKGIREIIPLVIILLYGLVVELLQRYASIGRSFEFTDILANITGFLPGWLFYRFFKWIREKGEKGKREKGEKGKREKGKKGKREKGKKGKRGKGEKGKSRE